MTGPDPSQVVVGVDGGNSKTDVVLADLQGRIVAEVRGPGTHPHRVGVPATTRAVAALVQEARAAAGLTEGAPLAAGAFHWANLDTIPMERAAQRELRRAGLVEHLVVRNDTFAVLKAGAPQGWGIAVVSGAGINATGVRPDGRTARFLSFGEISGDWGGGEALAAAGLGAAVRAGDGRGPHTSLRRLIPPVVGLRTVEAVAIGLMHGTVAHDRLHDLAPVVAAAAQAGDPVALGIIHRQGDEIVTMVTALIRRLALLRAETPVVLGGGTLQFGPPVLLQRIEAGLAHSAPRAKTLLLEVRPVAGPVLEALELLDAEPRARAAVRSALAVRAGELR